VSVRDAVDRDDAFFEPLDGRPGLTALDVVHAGGDLHQRAHDFDLVAHGLEEELFERVGRLGVVAGVEQIDRGVESGVVAHGV